MYIAICCSVAFNWVWLIPQTAAHCYGNSAAGSSGESHVLPTWRGRRRRFSVPWAVLIPKYRRPEWARVTGGADLININFTLGAGCLEAIERKKQWHRIHSGAKSGLWQDGAEAAGAPKRINSFVRCRFAVANRGQHVLMLFYYKSAIC